MTQEEKAKAYDKVYEKVAIRFGSNVANEIFSEFEMTEDERIKREILELVSIAGNGNQFEEIKDWLEKQGEQKSTIGMKSVEDSLGIDSETYNRIVDECIFGDQKSGVESTEHSHITTADSEFFQWIYDRLRYVYNENPNEPYMLSLKEIIEDMQKPTLSKKSWNLS